MGNYLVKPHGGKLINRVLGEPRKERLLQEVDELSKIVVDDETRDDIRNIAEGVFSPLEGFMEREDFTSVVHRGRLTNGSPWTLPIVLDVSQDIRSSVKDGDDVILTDLTGQPVALLHLNEIYAFNKKETASHVFGTEDKSHPSVGKIIDMGDFLLGGKIDLITKPKNHYERYHLSPKEAREIFEKRKWRTVAGFQTRNVPHLGHEYIQKTALALVDGIFVNPIIGKKKRGDFKDEVILTTYETLIKSYFREERVVLGILQTEMRYAGPKEAIFHAIIHFIVGRDHAGVGDFYPPYAAHDIFKEYPDLGITPLFFPSVFFCNTCKSITNDKACPHSQKCHQELSGTKMRKAIYNGEIGDSLVRPEVAEVVIKWKDPLVEEKNR
jgi:sulfate adenylyltransferase